MMDMDPRRMIEEAFPDNHSNSPYEREWERLCSEWERLRWARAELDAERERLRTHWRVLWCWTGAVAISAVLVALAARAAGLASIGG